MKRFILTGAPGAGKALSRYPGLPTSSLLAAEIGRIARQELFGRAVFIVRNRAPMNAPDPVALGRESFERQAWRLAYDQLSAADAVQSEPEDLERLAITAPSARSGGRKGRSLEPGLPRLP